MPKSDAVKNDEAPAAVAANQAGAAGQPGNDGAELRDEPADDPRGPSATEIFLAEIRAKVALGKQDVLRGRRHLDVHGVSDGVMKLFEAVEMMLTGPNEASR